MAFNWNNRRRKCEKCGKKYTNSWFPKHSCKPKATNGIQTKSEAHRGASKVGKAQIVYRVNKKPYKGVQGDETKWEKGNATRVLEVSVNWRNC